MLDEVALPPEKGMDDEAHAAELAFWQRAMNAAESGRRSYEDIWDECYKLKRSHVPARTPGDWHSKVFIPLVFFTIQTILPRLVANLPTPVVEPVGPDDTEGARKMEQRLRWAADQSNLMLAMIEAFDTALTYGTGILKVRPMKKVHRRRTVSPLMRNISVQVPRPIIDPSSGMPMTDIDGQDMTETEEVIFGEEPELDESGQPMTESLDEDVISYVGPVAEAVDIYNFFVAPDATCIQDARYVIQRRFISQDEFRRRIDDGTYTTSSRISDSEFYSSEDDPKFRREDIINMGGSAPGDDTRKEVEILECWKRSDGTVTHLANRKAIVRHGNNPFRHGEVPFVRIVDHLNPFEFWGTGEVEHLRGIQDAVNALWNQRIDNIRLLMNAMFMLDTDAITDKTDLRIRPGGTIRVQNPNGLPLQNVIERIDMGDVTSSAYTEVTELIGMSEKISGANGYTSGAMPLDDTNQTATGAAILSEQGNARFALKSALAEMTGLNDLMRLYGELLQQFTPPDILMAITDPAGAPVLDPMTGAPTFEAFGEDAANAALNYRVEAQSTTQTETVRQNQSLSLLRELVAVVDPVTGMPVVNVNTLVEDVLRSYNKKDLARYAPPPPPMPDPMQMMALPSPGGMPMEEEVPA